MLFERQMNAHFREMDCLLIEAVETARPIGVGLKKSSREALIAEFGGEIVEKASRARGILLLQITCPAVAPLVAAEGSPSEA